jgi:cytochrome c6
VLVGMALNLGLFILSPQCALAEDQSSQGAVLFEQHCAACHINGGNIIRRGKTLKLAALERRGLASVDAIAEIAAHGIGQMSGYQDALGPDGDQLVAEWIWTQAQNAWIQG